MTLDEVRPLYPISGAARNPSGVEAEVAGISLFSRAEVISYPSFFHRRSLIPRKRPRRSSGMIVMTYRLRVTVPVLVPPPRSRCGPNRRTDPGPPRLPA